MQSFARVIVALNTIPSAAVAGLAFTAIASYSRKQWINELTFPSWCSASKRLNSIH
jgi:hypothetical protein